MYVIHSSRNVVIVHEIKAYVGVKTYIHLFLTSILEAERSNLPPALIKQEAGQASQPPWMKTLLLLLKIET
jgi:hypothetical protein